MTLLNTLTTIS